jgi:hypothetical protein
MPQEYLTIPAFKTCPFGSPTRGGCGRFPSGALRTPFIPRRINPSKAPAPRKLISEKAFDIKIDG